MIPVIVGLVPIRCEDAFQPRSYERVAPAEANPQSRLGRSGINRRFFWSPLRQLELGASTRSARRKCHAKSDGRCGCCACCRRPDAPAL